jgi:YVTN family beta-propeller protein
VRVSPDGRHALVTSSGQAVQNETVEMFDISSGERTGVQVYNGRLGRSVFYGLAFSRNGRRAWASGGGQGVVHAYRVTATGALVPRGRIRVGHFPAGMVLGETPRGVRLYVADNMGGEPFSTGPYADPPGHFVTVIDPRRNRVTARIDLGRPLDPFGVTFNADATKAYVTNWTGRSVAVIDTARQRVKKTIVLSPPGNPLQADHPTAIVRNPVSDEIYVANASSDTVSVLDSRRDVLVETIDVALVPGSPKGSMPEGLAVSPDGRRLYVALAGENAVAVVDVGSRRVLGFIPTGWYPADVAVTPDGRRIVVVNTNGFGAEPNPCGPMSPLLALGCGTGIEYLPGYFENQYLGTMIKGTVQVVDVPEGPRDLSNRLARWTERVRRNNHVDWRPVPRPEHLRRIEHVIYIIKENRTYDQMFGDLPRGNGDPSLTLFHDESAPNQRELAQRFVLFDNFYVDAEVSQDGHPWSLQATATDYVDKTWPFDYAWAFYRNYDSEFVPLRQQFPTEPLASDPSVPRTAAAATVGYLWDNAYDHNVSFRDYGEATPLYNPNCHPKHNFSSLTRLQKRFGNHVAPRFPGWNMDCSDHAIRFKEWRREFVRFERREKMPRLQIVYFPNDHTQGTAPGTATPASYVADNDLAVGKLVQEVSHSSFWKSTAIFILEDDAQDGPDHVDPHRSTALVISPFTQHARVDSTHYDTAAMLATIEDLLGLSPMSIFDQRATRMWAPFFGPPDYMPYRAIRPTVIPFGATGYPVNRPDAPLGAESAAQNFSMPDGADEQTLNEAIWRSVRGSDSRMPSLDGD